MSLNMLYSSTSPLSLTFGCLPAVQHSQPHHADVPMPSPCRPAVGGHFQDKQAGGCQVLTFWTAEEQGKIAATLTRVNVKVHVVAWDGCHRRGGVSLVAGVLRCVKYYWLGV